MNFKGIFKFYHIEVYTYQDGSMTIQATNRMGNTYCAHLKRNHRYWEGSTDFGRPNNIVFKGIINWLYLKLIAEAKDYDSRFYRFKSYVTYDGEVERPITWGEAGSKWGEVDNTPEPTFKGSYKLIRE